MSSALRELWGVPDLERELQALEPGLRMEVVPAIGSTNSALLDWATQALRMAPNEGVSCISPARLLVAEHQTQGRGRMGRVWTAQVGACLTFSLALKLNLSDWSGLSLAVGIALADALEPWPAPPSAATEDPRIVLKWPNDLWLRDQGSAGGGRKLAGVLIETCGAPGVAGRMCVVGVGLNLLQHRVEGASSGVAWMQELCPDLTGPQALRRIAPGLLAGLRKFEQQGFAPLMPRYARRDLLLGRAVVTSPPQAATGIAMGVDASGVLQVRGADGTLHRVASGEVSVRALSASMP